MQTSYFYKSAERDLKEPLLGEQQSSSDSMNYGQGSFPYLEVEKKEPLHHVRKLPTEGARRTPTEIVARGPSSAATVPKGIYHDSGQQQFHIYGAPACFAPFGHAADCMPSPTMITVVNVENITPNYFQSIENRKKSPKKKPHHKGTMRTDQPYTQCPDSYKLKAEIKSWQLTSPHRRFADLSFDEKRKILTFHDRALISVLSKLISRDTNSTMKTYSEIQNATELEMGFLKDQKYFNVQESKKDILSHTLYTKEPPSTQYIHVSTIKYSQDQQSVLKNSLPAAMRLISSFEFEPTGVTFFQRSTLLTDKDGLYNVLYKISPQTFRNPCKLILHKNGVWKWSYPPWLEPQQRQDFIKILAARIELQIWKRFLAAHRYEPRHKDSRTEMPPEEEFEDVHKEQNFEEIGQFWESLTPEDQDTIIEMNERRVGKPDEDHIKKFKTLTSVGMVASEFIRDLYEPAITGLKDYQFIRKCYGLFKVINLDFHEKKMKQIELIQQQEEMAPINGLPKRKSKKKKQTDMKLPLQTALATTTEISLREKELAETFGNDQSQQAKRSLNKLFSPTTQSTCSTVCNDSSRKKKKKRKNKGRGESKEESKEDILNIRALFDKNKLGQKASEPSIFSSRQPTTSPSEIQIEISLDRRRSVSPPKTKLAQTLDKQELQQDSPEEPISPTLCDFSQNLAFGILSEAIVSQSKTNNQEEVVQQSSEGSMEERNIQTIKEEKKMEINANSKRNPKKKKRQSNNEKFTLSVKNPEPAAKENTGGIINRAKPEEAKAAPVQKIPEIPAFKIAESVTPEPFTPSSFSPSTAAEKAKTPQRTEKPNKRLDFGKGMQKEGKKGVQKVHASSRPSYKLREQPSTQPAPQPMFTPMQYAFPQAYMGQAGYPSQAYYPYNPGYFPMYPAQQPVLPAQYTPPPAAAAAVSPRPTSEVHTQFSKIDKQIRNYTKEMSDFIKYLERDHTIILGDIKDHIRSIFGRKSDVKMFGSLATGLAALSSDMDLAVLNVGEPTASAMLRLQTQLEMESAFQQVKVIDTASVPIIKLVVNLGKLRKSHGLDEDLDERPVGMDAMPEKINIYKVDIAFDEDKNSKVKLGIKSSEFIKALIKEYSSLKPLVLVLKRFLRSFQLNTAYHGKQHFMLGGLNSHSLVIMVVAVLNHYKSRINLNSLGKLLVLFFGFYGKFDYSKFEIAIGTGAALSQTSKNQQLVVVDPLDPTNNTASSCFQFRAVLSYFQAAYQHLVNLPETTTQNVLESLESPSLSAKANDILQKMVEQEERQKQHEESMQRAELLGVLQGMLQESMSPRWEEHFK